MKPIKDVILPGYFENQAAANNRRDEFDYQNISIVCNESKIDICFIGDSITHFWELGAYFSKYGALINRGIGGDIVQNVNRRFEADVIQNKPNVVVLKVGVNNLWFIEELIQNQDKEFVEKSINEVTNMMKNQYEAIVKKCKENNQKLIICSILPTISIDLKNKEIVKMNNFLKELSEKEEIFYADYHSKMVQEDGITMLEGLSFDGLHPHVMGYNIMASVLIPILDKAIEL